MARRYLLRKLAIIFWVGCAFAASTHAATLTVKTTADGVPDSLRTVIANAAAGDTIVFQIPTGDAGFNSGTGYWTITLFGDTAAHKTLTIDKNLTIDGSAQKIVVRRDNNAPTDFEIFLVQGGKTVTLRRLWISNGNTLTESTAGNNFSKDGGGIRNFGTLTVDQCRFTGNAAQTGGAIFNFGDSLTVSRCTFSGNSAVSAGAIYSVNTNNSNLIERSTFNQNNATNGGALYNNHGLLLVRSCTISGNTASGAGTQGGGGILTIGTNSFGNNGSTHCENTIVVGNSGSPGPDINGFIISEGHNLIGSTDSNTGFTASGDQTGITAAQANLEVLAENGGFASTMRPKPGSFALDRGKATADATGQLTTTDQRGFPRPVDRPEGNSPSGDASDVGAVELGAPQPGPTFTVNTLDEHDDGECTTDDCTFLEALNAANAVSDLNTINFDPSLSGSAFPNYIPTYTVTPTGAAISNPVTIVGPGAKFLGLTGASRGRMLRVTSSNVKISGLSFNSGAITDDGGAINNTGGLTLVDCEFVNNGSSKGNGGAIYNALTATLSISGCLIKGNSASSQFGGGVYNDGIFNATNCTFSENTAVRGGGLISRFSNGDSRTTLRNCTFTANTATSTSGGTADGGGGFYAEGGPQQHHVGNCIIAGNTNAVNPDVRGQCTSDGHNLIGNVANAVGFSNNVNGDQVGTPGGVKNPKLSGLGNYGGPTYLYGLLSDSTAINAGDDALAPPTDQRGFPRVGVSDIGAFEFGSSLPTPTPTPTPTPNPSASPTPTPEATATPTPVSQLQNLSTRKQVGTDSNVLIGGFIVVGTEDKKLLLRGLGPTLGIDGALADPTLELHRADTTLLAANNNWQDTQAAEISATGIPPANDLEAAIVATVSAKPAAEQGAGYTGVLAGQGGTTGIGLLEIYDLGTAVNSKLANISTRGFVGSDPDVLIGGFIPGPSGRLPLKVLVRALGPSLADQGVSGALQDPVLELHDANGTLLVNDNWRDASNAAEIQATLPPPDDRESAIITTLPPATSGYTAVVRGANGTSGVALVEVYALQ